MRQLLDKDFWRQPVARWAVVAAYVFIAVAAGYGQAQDAHRRNDLKKETTERLDQSCTIFEQQHLEDVIQLAKTYQYLDNLSVQQRTEGLNVFIIKDLPETEKKAKTDSAPDFCDEPNLGLPEPDPTLPTKPAWLGQ
jgi:hypothetical protein